MKFPANSFNSRIEVTEDSQQNEQHGSAGAADPLGRTLRPGDQTGRYEPGRLMFDSRFKLIREIGSGGMGVVWLAEEAATGEKRALKLFTPEFLRAKANQAELEAEAGMRLNHPNIVRTFEYVRESPEGAIVMEYVDGVDLLRLPDQERKTCYDPDDVLPWAKQICAALHHAHTQKPEKVIHRDVKPHNVLRENETGVLKLGDFGISRVVQDTILATRGSVVVDADERATPKPLPPTATRSASPAPSSSTRSRPAGFPMMCFR